MFPISPLNRSLLHWARFRPLEIWFHWNQAANTWHDCKFSTAFSPYQVSCYQISVWRHLARPTRPWSVTGTSVMYPWYCLPVMSEIRVFFFGAFTLFHLWVLSFILATNRLIIRIESVWPHFYNNDKHIKIYTSLAKTLKNVYARLIFLTDYLSCAWKHAYWWEILNPYPS